jgi:[ribosomal protein S5]-alanine N-acetyltransferase
MSTIAEPPTITFIPIDVVNLRRIAACESVQLEGLLVPDGALPPAEVAMRSLVELALGTPELWCVPYLIVSPSRATVLGACRFKTAPVDGTVEISYGLARSERGKGIATAAIGQFLQLAASTGLVREVIAHILPTNKASSRLVSRLGFSMGHTFIDDDGDTVAHWSWPAS